MLSLSADELLTTTRSVRKRLDFDRPVDRPTIQQCLEIALQAPNGSNMNSWKWVIVDDPKIIRQASTLYRKGTEDFIATLGDAVGDNYAGAVHSRFRRYQRVGANTYCRICTVSPQCCFP